jgi:hypothetical protein
VNAGHREKGEALGEDPLSSSFPMNGLAVKNVERELEVGEGLPKGSDKLFDFGGHSHFFLNVIS